nr:hypothetical protein CFP56_05865 [Quercus suber]
MFPITGNLHTEHIDNIPALTIGGASATASISPCGNNAPAPAVASSGTSSLLPISDGDSCKVIRFYPFAFCMLAIVLEYSAWIQWPRVRSTLTLQPSQVFSKKSPDTGSAGPFYCYLFIESCSNPWEVPATGSYQNGRNRSEQDQVSLIEEGQSYKGICRTGVKLNDTNEDIKQVKQHVA